MYWPDDRTTWCLDNFSTQTSRCKWKPSHTSWKAPKVEVQKWCNQRSLSPPHDMHCAIPRAFPADFSSTSTCGNFVSCVRKNVYIFRKVCLPIKWQKLFSIKYFLEFSIILITALLFTQSCMGFHHVLSLVTVAGEMIFYHFSGFPMLSFFATRCHFCIAEVPLRLHKCCYFLPPGVTATLHRHH